MTEDEIDQLADRIAANPDLQRKLRPRHWRDFLFSENFKWAMTALAIPAATFVYGLWQAHNANSDRALEAQLGDARNNIAAMTNLLPSLSDSDGKKADMAYIVLRQLPKAQHSQDKSLEEALKAIVEKMQNSPDQGERQRAASWQESYSLASNARPAPASAPTTIVAPTNVDTAEASKPRLVYIQIFGNAQRSAATDVQALLRDNGIGAPGIEDVSAKLAGRMSPATRPQMLYFSEGDIGGARWLASHLPKVQEQEWSVVRAQAKGVPSGQLELWWPYPAGGSPA
jgi:hypothetical protein